MSRYSSSPIVLSNIVNGNKKRTKKKWPRKRKKNELVPILGASTHQGKERKKDEPAPKTGASIH